MRSRRKLALGRVTIVAGVMLAAFVTASWAGASAPDYPRAQTLITSGTQWGEIAGTNPYSGNYAVGEVGLVYETLLRYDPIADEYIPWLAKSASWTGPYTYTVTIRPGIKWANGAAFTASDVAYNFKLGRFQNAFWNNMYQRLYAGSGITVLGDTVTFRFNGTPNYAQWMNLIWNLPMIYPGQATGYITTEQSFLSFSPGNPIGTGPYQLDSAGYDPATRVVWVKKPVWWAAQQALAPSPAPQYIIDLCNTSNTNALSGLLTGIEDLNNNYLPGIQSLVASGRAQTYYSGPPYFLSANTAWLTPNTTHKPLTDPAFRKALATSINVGQIINVGYGKLVLPASPTGLLPTWKKWINSSLVSSKGFSYSTSKAISMLTAAGYQQVGGWFRNKDGSAINLKIAVPAGWSDWETARGMIVSSAAAAHIKLTVDAGDFNHYQSQRNSGAFDLVIDNTAQISDNPWTYFNFLFHLPIVSGGAGQTFANFSRYNNPTAWNLTQKLDQTPPTATATRQSIMNQLETIVMDDLPAIPLWYNGAWSQTQSEYWTNWPSSTSSRNYVPIMWRGYMQMTGIDMIDHLVPAAP